MSINKNSCAEERMEIVCDFEERILDALESMGETCALDVAEHGGCNQTEAGQYIGMERQIVNALERRALYRCGEVHADPRGEGNS